MKTLKTSTLVLGLLLGGVNMKADVSAPKVVVGIVVDQLRTDYLEQLRPYFGSNGFNRLIREGAYLTDVDFRNTVSDAPSGTAVVYTGAWPAVNGIASAEVLDNVQKRNVPVLAADATKLKSDYSPDNLKLSTIADEFFITYGNLSKIYSIAGDPQVAVIATGHAGNSAIWLDESMGRWITPAYYGSLPPVVANKNHSSPLSSRLASNPWRPLNAASHYGMDGIWNESNFNYSFSGSTRDTYQKFKASAPFNSEVTDVAVDLLKQMKSGSNQASMLNIEYSLAPFVYDYDGDNRPELIDSYMRLDSELGRLLAEIDRTYGSGNVLVFLSGSGYAQEPSIPENNAKIPTGEITLKKAESLLNSFLSAQYGNGDYVALIKDNKLYLDSRLAEQKGIDLSKLRTEVKAFLLKMGGVSEAFTIDEILDAGNSRKEEIALGLDMKHSPDLFLFFTPGWTVTDDNAYPAVSHKVRMSSPAIPAFILAPNVGSQVISVPVEATRLAPTLASILRIRPPNGAGAKAVTLGN